MTPTTLDLENKFNGWTGQEQPFFSFFFSPLPSERQLIKTAEGQNERQEITATVKMWVDEGGVYVLTCNETGNFISEIFFSSHV